ncbi:MAG: hypothetical protein JWO61_25 [Candidatus Saccharibacteria bacterium]|nr:hypothetical protein [Candidatus Saccharibacteria bacterium]
MKHYIVYIPGLGDGYDGLRRFLLFFWRIFGVKVEHVPMKWYDTKSYEEKYKRVDAAIRNAQALGYTVSVIGESAGGSIAMNLFARNETLHRLISLCGVNSYRTPISPRIFQRSPAFKESVSMLNESQTDALKRVKHITSVTARYDPTVPIKSNIIPGARHVTIWSVGHLTTILLCLSLFSFVLVREVRRNI